MVGELRTPPAVFTYDDYRRLPDDGKRYELIEGDLYVTPAPNTPHQRTSRNLEFLLLQHARAHDLGEVYYAPFDVIFGRTSVVQPDILFVRRDRIGIITERGVEGAPDLVVEILSPSTQEQDHGIKQLLYLRYGVAHYWLADPVAMSLTEHVLAERQYVIRATHVAPAQARTALFPELAIDLAEVFGA